MVATLGLFGLVRDVCEYYLPNNANTLWWSIGLGAFFLDAVSLQYLFCVHLFVGPCVAALLTMTHGSLTHDPCTRDCYCIGAQSLMSFFWVVVLFFREYVHGSPRPYKVVITLFAFVIFMASLVVTGTCTLGGMLFGMAVGAALGALMVYAYAAIGVPLVVAVGERARRTAVLGCDDPAGGEPPAPAPVLGKTPRQVEGTEFSFRDIVSSVKNFEKK